MVFQYTQRQSADTIVRVDLLSTRQMQGEVARDREIDLDHRSSKTYIQALSQVVDEGDRAILPQAVVTCIPNETPE